MEVMLKNDLDVILGSTLRGVHLAERVRICYSLGMSGPPRAIETPCVQVCVVDGASGLCLGCLRTLKEIAGWARFSDAERRALMVELPARRGRVAPEKLGA